MRIVVKISDIEIEVEHEDQGNSVNTDFPSIKAFLEKMTEKAVELYNNRIEKLNQENES